jgi:OFA family oxalate/formate antiporter-like MFS transporter
MKRKFFYGYIIVFVIFILQIVLVGPEASFGVFLKPITAEFNWPMAFVAGAFSAYCVVQAFSSILMGWLNDRMGPRFVMTICGILVGSGLMLMYFVHSKWQLYLFYVALGGIGTGGILAPQISTIARWFVKRRNIATGVLFAGGGVGGFIGPTLITWLIYSYGWREAFLFIGIVLFVLVILGAQFLKRDPSTADQLPDGDGIEVKNKESSDVSGLTTKQAFKTKKFWFFAIVIFCIGFCLWTVFIHIVPYAIDRGISPNVAAMILSAMSLAQVVGNIVGSIIADRIGNGRALVACVCLLLAVILLLLPIANPWLLGFIVIILAFGLGGTSVLQSSMTARLFGMKSHGAILGFIIFAFSIGSALGTYLAGLVYDYTGSYQLIFLLCVVLVVAAIIMAISLNHIRKTEAVV